jgi:hypothetical protein
MLECYSQFQKLYGHALAHANKDSPQARLQLRYNRDVAKFVLKPYNRNDPDESLIEDLRAVAEALNRSPTIDEYNRLGKYHAATLARRFG